MNITRITQTFAVALVLVLTAAGLWAAGAEEEPAAAAEKEMVLDPSTGEMVTAPEYGGTFTYATKEELPGPDTVIQGLWASQYVAPVLEKLAYADWATPRDRLTSSFSWCQLKRQGLWRKAGRSPTH